MAEDPSPAPADGGRPRGRRRAQAVDLEVGRRVRRRRLELGLTLPQAAERLGVSYQQLHKYENGLNRLSAGLLHRIAEVFGVEVGHFFADVDQKGLLGRARPDEAGRGRRRMLLELVRHAAVIRDPKHREALCRLARDLAALGAENPEDAQVEQLLAQSEAQPDRSR